MKIFAIADLHLSMGVENKTMDVFGERWSGHHIKLKDAWEKTVSGEDVVVIPGDVSWALDMKDAVPDLKYIESLPGSKVILKGNHDLWWGTHKKMAQMMGDNDITGIEFLYNNSFFIEETGVSICGTRGWRCPGGRETEAFTAQDEKIYRRELQRLERSLAEGSRNGGEIICFLHYPPCNNLLEPSGFTDLMEQYGVRHCYYGHLHGPSQKGAADGRLAADSITEYKLIAADRLDFTPAQVYPL